MSASWFSFSGSASRFSVAKPRRSSTCSEARSVAASAGAWPGADGRKRRALLPDGSSGRKLAEKRPLAQVRDEGAPELEPGVVAGGDDAHR